MPSLERKDLVDKFMLLTAVKNDVPAEDEPDVCDVCGEEGQ